MNMCISILVAFVLITIGISYKKENIAKPAIVLPIEVSGTWIWVATFINGPLGSHNPFAPANSGNKEKLVFTSTKEWKRLYNGSVANSGTFNLVHGTFINLSNSTFIYDQLNYFRNGSVLDADWYEIHNDTLIIDPG